MISVPAQDPVHALVPHTLTEPLAGSADGPLAGLTFMVKDLFAIAGRKVGNGNPACYAHAVPASRTARAIVRLLDAGASLRHHHCDSSSTACSAPTFTGQPINPRARSK
jgi:amidase